MRALPARGHLTSLAWIGLAATTLVPPRIAVALTFAASALLSLIGSRGRHDSYVVFGAIAALVWPW